MKIAFLFGGSGYIGGFALREFFKNNLFDKFVVHDNQGFEIPRRKYRESCVSES